MNPYFNLFKKKPTLEEFISNLKKNNETSAYVGVRYSNNLWDFFIDKHRYFVYVKSGDITIDVAERDFPVFERIPPDLYRSYLEPMKIELGRMLQKEMITPVYVD